MTRTMRLTLLIAGVLALAWTGSAGHSPGHTKLDSEFIPATIETNDTTTLYQLRGDGFTAGSGPNSSLYTHRVDCAFAGVQNNGRLVFFTVQHTDGIDGCRANPVRFLTIAGTGFDLDIDGTVELVETVVADVNMGNLFSSTSTSASLSLLRITYFADGSRVVEGGTGWKLNYASVPVAGSNNVRTVTALGDSANATLCEVVLVGKKNVCESRGPINLPFEFTVTLLP